MDSGAASGYQVPKESGNIDGALDFIKWFTQNEILDKWAEISKGIPAYDGVTLDYLSRYAQEALDSIGDLETFAPFPFLGYTNIGGVHVAAVLSGQETTLEACRAWGEEMALNSKEKGIAEFQD